MQAQQKVNVFLIQQKVKQGRTETFFLSLSQATSVDWPARAYPTLSL
jgi:hypothetical protein